MTNPKPARSVVIVDDDVPVLDFLRHAIPWDKLGLRLAGAFENGAKAYEHAVNAEPPDLLITDIGMPQMDGLQLTERVKKLKPDVSVIILSCHDEFKYAQQAIKLGVDDYVLKETVSPATLEELLRTVVKRLEEREAAEGAGKRLASEVQSVHNRSIRKEQFIRSLLYHPIADIAGWRELASGFGIRLGSAPVLPVLLVVDNYPEAKARFVSEDNCIFAVENVTEELLRSYGGDVAAFRVTHRELLLLFGPDPGVSGGTVGKYRVESVLKRIRAALGSYLKLSVTCMMGIASSDPLLLRSDMQRLADGRTSRFYLPEGVIADWAEPVFTQDDLFALYPQALDECRKVVLLQETDRIEPVVLAWAARIREGGYPPEAVKEWFLKMVLDLHMKFKTMEHVPSAYSREALHQTFLEAERLDRLSRYTIEAMREAASRMGAIYGQPQRAEIAEAQRFVELNIHRKISLEEVADHLHLNASYFSRLFKKETNETFVDFVTRTKMEKAKELLDLSRYTVREVADRLGYDNKSYFVKLFKAFCGVTPKEYGGKG
ncbi:response regulator [Paenibacillus sp. GYB004]|uniref:response regulator transcription factor n=1 Tax=Paenibacillus sp. GYB004 TaxID=2994393 RepID=UPI002F960D3A